MYIVITVILNANDFPIGSVVSLRQSAPKESLSLDCHHDIRALNYPSGVSITVNDLCVTYCYSCQRKQDCVWHMGNSVLQGEGALNM